MVRNVAALCTLLLALHHHLNPALAANNIGCLFSSTLCEQDREWCYDDHAFGHCLSSYGHYTGDDLHRYELGSEELRVLEQEMQRLFLLGYRWSHTYTQCVLQNILGSIRQGPLSTRDRQQDEDGDEEGKEYDISSCNGDLDQDLEGALRAIEGEELVDPRDLAIVRFTPSATDPHSDYADEVYFPPIKHPADHPDHDQDGEESSVEEGGEEGTDGGGGEEGEEEGVRGVGGREEDGGEEDNNLSPMPSHNLPPHPPPRNNHPPPDREDDRSHNFINYYDEPGYQNDVYQSPYDFQHNPVFGKRSNFIPRARPDQDQSLQLNYQPFIRKYSGGRDDRSSEMLNGMGRFRAQESVVFPSRYRDQQTQQDDGVFGESPVRPMYAEGGMQIVPPLDREFRELSQRDVFGRDDEVDDEGGLWSNNPAELRASPVGIPGFGDQQSLSDDVGNLRGFLDQANMPLELRDMPGERHGFSKQQSMLENLRGFEDKQNLDDLRGYGEQGNIPDDLRNYPDSLRNYAEQQSVPEVLKNMPGGLRDLPVDVPGFAEQQYLPYEEPEDVWPYQSDARSYADPRVDEWTMPSFISQRGPMDLGFRDSRPSVFGDLRNYGERRTLPEDLKNMGGYYPPPLPWNAPSRYRDLSRIAPLMMISDEDPNDADRLTGYESMFGPQLMDPAYRQQLFDYQDDYQDYADYQDYDQDYDQDPRQLTQKFVKKDEETVGGDYGDLTTGWNLARTERLDVKKPGPYFRSVNNFAFDSPRLQQSQGVSFMMASLQGSGMGKEPSTQPSDPHVPDLLLAERGYVNLAEEAATDKAASEQEDEEQKGQEKGEGEEENKEEEKTTTAEEEEEKEEGGGGEEKAALVSPSPKDLDLVEITVKEGLNEAKGRSLVRKISEEAGMSPSNLEHFSVEGNTVKFAVVDNTQGLTAADLARLAEKLKDEMEKDLEVEIVDIAPHQIRPEARVADPTPTDQVHARELRSSIVGQRVMAAAAVVCGVAAAVAVATGVLFLLRRHANSKSKLPLLASPHTQDSKDYEDLCRSRMAGKGTGVEGGKGGEDRPPSSGHPPSQRVSSLSKDSDNGNNSPSSRSSTSSWSEEPVASNMDISTGHMVLSYMEDHLKNKDRLEQEWIALCAYEAEPCATTIALKPENSQKNRYPDAVPYDHNRVLLNAHANISGSDYINASSITDHDPRNPAYIATQGPLETTAADFWQLVWEQGSVVIVMLTRLTENGHSFCYRYWPEEGSDLYHIYEVHLVSEHIWCDDYLVRSFYLKNVRTGETRTVTQFHFLSWHESGTPASTKALLEFRRKVNKSYRGRSCPIIVHCSDGIGRTGTYSLIDMVLNRMAKGAKEIDIAATLEHIRDQRPHMVRSKPQFEFVLMAVAEEVHAILKALPQ